MAETSPSQEPAQEPSQQPAPKRIRLSLACTACRKRKVRCDAETPKCRNCRLRGDVCQTTDPRKPEAVVSRKWPAKTSRLLAEQGFSIGGGGGGGGDGQQQAAAGPRPRGDGDGSETVPEADPEAPQPLSRIPVSFLTRAYHASTRERGGARALGDAESPDIVVNTDESSHRVKVGLVPRTLREDVTLRGLISTWVCSTWAEAVCSASAYLWTCSSSRKGWGRCPSNSASACAM